MASVAYKLPREEEHVWEQPLIRTGIRQPVLHSLLSACRSDARYLFRIPHIYRLHFGCKSSIMQRVMDGFPSGQRGQTVNLLATPSVVRIHHHPFVSSWENRTEMRPCMCRPHSGCDISPATRAQDTYAAVAELADARDLKSRG